MSNLQVGQKVVCINDKGWAASLCGRNYVPPNLPQYKAVYTVRQVVIDSKGFVGILLEEVRNALRDREHEQSFWAQYFRPVVDRKTDISIFQAMLTPKQVPVEVA